MSTNEVTSIENVEPPSTAGVTTQTYAADLFLMPGVHLKADRRIDVTKVQAMLDAGFKELAESIAILQGLGLPTEHWCEQDRALLCRAERLVPGCRNDSLPAAKRAKQSVTVIEYSRMRCLGYLLFKASESRTLDVAAAQSAADTEGRLNALKGQKPRRIRLRFSSPEGEDVLRLVSFAADPDYHLDSAVRRVQSAGRAIAAGVDREQGMAMIDSVAWLLTAKDAVEALLRTGKALEVL